MVMSLVGRPIRRVEDPRLVSGRGRFVDDVNPPGLLHLAIVRSSYPKARVTRIDTIGARAHPGVVAVVTGEDVAELGDIPSMRLPFAKIPPHPVLACRAPRTCR